MEFKLVSPFKPTGDQPQAIQQLTDGLLNGAHAQTLLGVTGSGKTFTIANVRTNIGRPTLVTGGSAVGLLAGLHFPQRVGASYLCGHRVVFLRKDKALDEKRMGQIWSKGKMTPQRKMLTSGKRLSLTLTECRRNFFRRMAEKIFFGIWH